ncbi:hypothetical protein N7462_004646 [Penicillium macrosclerotiorum]|uniref:uncharacterized protein n=1 Tax=Penicillium macrosclerotiorum TaxID=303699 RepID=UPI0025465E11|nr:uncharacterized protein N7462_004646 [Penicillium macrosclerotiorum]KAJ5690254.1 hypothetical protein N7462_004646 [Penicillium macrosclerotiorum]
MMVPRAFLFTSAPPQKAMQPFSSHDHSARPPLNQSGILPAKQTENAGSSNTHPVVIPPKRGSRTPLHRESRPRTLSKTSASSRRSSSSSSSNERHLPTSVASMLNATAIPVPRRSWSTRRPRKLPRGNHVEEFSRMMQEGLKSKDDYLLGGSGNTPLDILLSPPDEDHDRYSTGNESELEPSFSARSLSSDSMPSLEPDVGSPCSSSLPPTPASHKSSERRHLRYSTSEDCALNHPLLETEMDDLEIVEFENPDEPIRQAGDEPSKRSASFGTFPRLRSSFKSNLTASLRAIKSAAQSVSTFTTPSVQPEDFLTRSLFTITPEMTDDRRPPPMKEPPSPALRRYLNPTPISPAEMCVYHDHPRDKQDPAGSCPVSIQMQTYRRSRDRGHRRNHFHVVPSKNRDQYYTFDPEVPPMSRQREPRENSDFLRMVVLEMNMRRSGKLREDIPTRARIMLPPRKSNPYRLSGDYEDHDNDTVPSRWVGVSA